MSAMIKLLRDLLAILSGVAGVVIVAAAVVVIMRVRDAARNDEMAQEVAPAVILQLN
jgi:hypothetical protein